MILNYAIWETADSIQEDHWAQTVKVTPWIIWFFLPLPGDWQLSTLTFFFCLFLPFSLLFFFFSMILLKYMQLQQDTQSNGYQSEARALLFSQTFGDSRLLQTKRTGHA